MTHSLPSRALPTDALRKFKIVAKADWVGGVQLAELLERVNLVAEVLVGEEEYSNSKERRVKRIFTERSFRHYQTLGCIDAPEKQGRLASYGFRHFLQALLVRKFLWERLSAEQISVILISRATRDLEGMLIGVAKKKGDSGSVVLQSEQWIRYSIIAGVELHISVRSPRLSSPELKRVMGLMQRLIG